MDDHFTPRLYDVRRVPTRYQRILPFSIVKRYQCVVLGSAPHILTVGVVDVTDSELFSLLQRVTGVQIFPVLVEVKRMRLIIARMERSQRFRRRFGHTYSLLTLPAQMRILLLLWERSIQRD